jgi:type VI secretion system protein ImpH
MTARNDILASPVVFDFYEACRRLETENPSRPKISESAARREDYVAFGQDPFFAFPTANLTRAQDAGGGAAVNIMVAFLGLLGPQGALPLASTEEAYRYALANDDAFPRFLDVFNNRFIQMFFRAWADARPVVHRDRPQDGDRFSAFAGAPIGLGGPALLNLDSVDDEVKIAFAGLLAPKTRSASRLKSLLAAVFRTKVEIIEFVGVRLLFEPDQRSRLGQGFSTLGRDVLVGSGVFSVEDKIRVRIYASSYAQYRELLPDGAKAGQLADLMSFYLGSEMEWDIELALPVADAQPARLGQSGQLGWTGWLSPNWTEQKGAYRTDARFDLSKRFPRARLQSAATSASKPSAQPSAGKASKAKAAKAG